MSARQYSFSGSTVDASIVFDEMRDVHERGYVSITFYTDSTLSTIATPTAGIILVEVSEDGVSYGTIENGTVLAKNVSSSAKYLRPNWSGSTEFLAITFSDIASAPNFLCTVYRFGGF